MEDGDFQTRFRNCMQLTLDRETAVLDREGHEPVTVHVEKIDDETYNIDWSPVDERWGQSQLQFGCMEGTPGLIEAKGKFWKMHAVLPDTAVQSAHGWPEGHAREYRAGRRGLRTGASPASAASSTKPDVTRNCPGQREDNSAEASAESGVTPDQQQAQDAAESPAALPIVARAELRAELSQEWISSAVATGRKACPGCNGVLVWSDHSEGRYSNGWACDNHRTCGVWRPGPDLAAEERWRFLCLTCHRDFCKDCGELLLLVPGP